MNEPPRKKSPRAPSITLDDGLDRALRIYEKEKRHAAPVNAIAQHLGYKNANNGTVLSIFASLRYYGLVERPKEGFLAVSKDVENYKFSPSESMRQALRVKWLKTPPLFTDLLEKYHEGLPSDATLKYELIQRGFGEKTADTFLSVFRRSVDYASYFEQQQPSEALVAESEGEEASPVEAAPPQPSSAPHLAREAVSMPAFTGMDRIPVRLAGGRRAWLEVPTPFYAADKARLKAQIDLLLADDEDNTEGVVG